MSLPNLQYEEMCGSKTEKKYCLCTFLRFTSKLSGAPSASAASFLLKQSLSVSLLNHFLITITVKISWSRATGKLVATGPYTNDWIWQSKPTSPLRRAYSYSLLHVSIWQVICGFSPQVHFWTWMYWAGPLNIIKTAKMPLFLSIHTDCK